MENEFLNGNGVADGQKCSICGEELTKYGNKELKDGIICRNCIKLASPWLSDEDYRNRSVKDMLRHLEYRKQNEEKIKAFKESKKVEGKYSLYIDSDDREFVVSKRKDLLKENADVIGFDALEEVEISEQEYLEEKTYDLFFEMKLKHDELNRVSFRVNEFVGLDRNSEEYKEAMDTACAYMDALLEESGLSLEEVADE